MTKTTSLLLYSLAFWLAASSTIQAQTNLGPLIGQLDSSQRATYLRNLDSLTRKFNVDSLKLSIAVDSLNRGIFGQNPLLGINDSVGGFRIAIDSFFHLFKPTDSLGLRDRDTLLGEYGRLKNISISFADSLKGLFGNYQDSIFLSSGVPLANYPLNDSLWLRGSDSLRFNVTNLFKSDSTKPDSLRGLGRFAPVLDFLFNKNNFKIELFSGLQNNEVAYLSLRQKLGLPVIGLRTVEQFNSLWESRWQMQGSWNMNEVQATSGERVFVAQEAKTPELLQGEFAIMFNPVLSIFSNANRSVRLISSLGIEISTYAPAHKNIDVLSINNKGFTTGMGPQIGAGFSLQMGPITTFALGTMTYGEVLTKAKVDRPRVYYADSYTFFSTCISAGIRYGNAFSLRYENRTSDWADNIKATTGFLKNARTNQVTVGIPLSGLSR